MKNNIRDNIIYLLALFSATITTACSDTEDPINIEPEITVSEATDITRTGAVLNAKITTKGTGTLSYIRFRYGETEDMNLVSPSLSVESGDESLRIENLKPGTTYHYCAEGGNNSAVIKSQTLTFTTIPNNPPSVSAAIPMSSGPVGLIVGFEITDDGGELITEAGLEVKNSATGEILIRLLPEKPVTTGEHCLYVKVPPTKIQYIITPFASNSLGKSTGESISFTPGDAVVLESPGVLSTLLGTNRIPFDNLVITGPLNGDDFRFLRRMLRAPLLPGESEVECTASAIDLSDAVIVEGGSTYDGSRFTIHATLSTGLFSDCKLLTDIKLPVTATAVLRDAFAGCTGLRSLTIPANITLFQTSSGCDALEEIKVSDANSSFRSLDGVLLNGDMTELLWFPIAKKGHYSLPASIKSIGENAFRGTHISSLSFPDDLNSIGRGALSSTMLKEVTLPDKIVNVPEALFQNSTYLSTVALGAETAYIGSYAFSGCVPAHIHIKAFFPPFVSENAFGLDPTDLFDKCTLHVPSGAAAAYRRHREWGFFKNITED